MTDSLTDGNALPNGGDEHVETQGSLEARFQGCLALLTECFPPEGDPDELREKSLEQKAELVLGYSINKINDTRKAELLKLLMEALSIPGMDTVSVIGERFGIYDGLPKTDVQIAKQKGFAGMQAEELVLCFLDEIKSLPTVQKWIAGLINSWETEDLKAVKEQPQQPQEDFSFQRVVYLLHELLPTDFDARTLDEERKAEFLEIFYQILEDVPELEKSLKELRTDPQTRTSALEAIAIQTGMQMRKLLRLNDKVQKHFKLKHNTDIFGELFEKWRVENLLREHFGVQRLGVGDMDAAQIDALFERYTEFLTNFFDSRVNFGPLDTNQKLALILRIEETFANPQLFRKIDLAVLKLKTGLFPDTQIPADERICEAFDIKPEAIGDVVHASHSKIRKSQLSMDARDAVRRTKYASMMAEGEEFPYETVSREGACRMLLTEAGARYYDAFENLNPDERGKVFDIIDELLSTKSNEDSQDIFARLKFGINPRGILLSSNAELERALLLHRNNVPVLLDRCLRQLKAAPKFRQALKFTS